MKYHNLHDWVPAKPLAESLWERMCVGCVTVCLWVCVFVNLESPQDVWCVGSNRDGVADGSSENLVL